MHNRKQERDQLKRKLQAGISINMPAPRRIGKTWTINRLAFDLKKEGWTAVEVDVEGLQHPREFSRLLCKSIEGQISVVEKYKSHFHQRIQGILGGEWDGSPIDALGKIDPIEFLETLISSLSESVEDSAILIDEIAYFFLKCAERDKDEAYNFAYRLRAIQQKYKGVRWLLTGSIGLGIVAKRYGLGGAFVDFETFALKPFSKKEARSFLRDPATQSQINHIFDASDNDFDAMFDELGWLAPYYLKLVANETRPSKIDQIRKIDIATTEDFEAAFEKLLLPGRDTEFSVWEEHINKNLAASDKSIAMTVLNTLSAGQSGEKLDTILANVSNKDAASSRKQLKQILAILINDGLLHVVGDRYQFQSGLVRRYWKEYEAE